MNDAPNGAGYAAAYAAWQRDPAAWWSEVAEGVTWDERWDKVFDPSLGPYGQWFAGGTLNTCYNCINRHVAAGRGAQPALIWDSAMTGTSSSLASSSIWAFMAVITATVADPDEPMAVATRTGPWSCGARRACWISSAFCSIRR